MVWLAILLFVALAGLVGQGARRSPPATRRQEPDFTTDDPVEALARYGTDADACRLIEQGRGDDLAGLGYHHHHHHHGG